ncbi:hypothetical protein [Wenzhouxiangella sp. XN24]|uniref:hypothetical protein n=1 Tax=Wenzhouxiangella sp. XN24 TaxID=2713569 RepID=UPI0013EE108A|nr:hypothetical protein [Wenzhouxiangella sp. XN24]NGX16293.1 hypothetical protein [Wenzhouxiangella sp. XN24]
MTGASTIGARRNGISVAPIPAPLDALAAIVEAPIGTLTSPVEPPIDVIAAVIQSLLDAVAFPLQTFRETLAACCIGAIGRPVVTSFRGISTTVEPMVHTISTMIHACFNAIALAVEPCLGPVTRVCRGVPGPRQADQGEYQNWLVHAVLDFSMSSWRTTPDEQIG